MKWTVLESPGIMNLCAHVKVGDLDICFLILPSKVDAVCFLAWGEGSGCWTPSLAAAKAKAEELLAQWQADHAVVQAALLATPEISGGGAR